MRELRRLNFRDLISIGVPDIDSYTFDKQKTPRRILLLARG